MGEITRIIEQGREGAGADPELLFAAAYEELKKLAHSRLARSAPMTLLDSTALVNELWLRLPRRSPLHLETRRRFFAYAAQVMRTVIVDQLRQRAADRRGGGERALTLDTALGDHLVADEQVLRVHDALESLAQVDARLSQVVEMRYFGGMTENEIAETLQLSERTVRRDWEKARLLLAAMLDPA